MTLLERFEAKINKNGPNGCWLWIACCDSYNYGMFRINRKTRRAHRISWEMYRGSVPKNTCVLHRCDNPTCVNPEHLFLGTHTENVTDMIQKGRAVFGEKVGSAKLNTRDILEIRALAGKILQRKIAVKFGVTQQTISKIINNKKWKHL